MTEKWRNRIDRIAGTAVGLSCAMILFLVATRGFIVCGPGAEAAQMMGRLQVLLLAVPGLLLGVLSSSTLDRVLGWAGWAYIVWFSWVAFQHFAK